jgi:hypothetical protein
LRARLIRFFFKLFLLLSFGEPGESSSDFNFLAENLFFLGVGESFSSNIGDLGLNGP